MGILPLLSRFRGAEDPPQVLNLLIPSAPRVTSARRTEIGFRVVLGVEFRPKKEMGLRLAAVCGLRTELALDLATGTSEGFLLGQGGGIGFASLGCSLPPSCASRPPPPRGDPGFRPHNLPGLPDLLIRPLPLPKLHVGDPQALFWDLRVPYLFSPPGL